MTERTPAADVADVAASTEAQSPLLPTSSDALRELNRLLESALRMGGADDGKNDASLSAVEASGAEEAGAGSAASGDSWRLETARRLGWLLSSQLHAIRDEPEHDADRDVAHNPLLPALTRQSRYWIPLLLSWIRQDCTDDDEDAFESTLSLKQRRRRHHHAANPGRKYVQIESLRALNLLHQWMARCHETEQPLANHPHAPKKSNNLPALTSQQPLTTHTQKLLLRHPDAVPIVLSLLSSPDKAVVEQAAWILGSIAAGGLETMSPPSLACVANAAATAMRSGSDHVAVAVPASSGGDEEEVKESSAGGSRKEKSGTLTARDAILGAGTLPALLGCLDANPMNIELHRIGVWCLSSLMEGRYSNSGGGGGNAPSLSGERKFYGEEIDVMALLPTLRRLLHMEDWEVLAYACWTLSHVCDGPASNINAVLYSENPTKKKGSAYFDPERGLVPRLIQLLMHPYPKVVKPALRTIGNVVCAECTDTQHTSIPDYTEVILDLNAVPFLRDLVCHENREIQKESCWTLSNIAAGTISQIQAVIDSGVIPPLVELVSDPSTDKEVRSEACWVVLNATSCGSDEQIETLVEEGCVNVLGVLLAEPSMIMMSMEGLERVLQTEEAKDAADLRMNNGSSMGLPQRPVIVICAKLINGVMELNHSSSAAAKRARRIWDTHFVACALCQGFFSRHRINDSRFCHECKCHVCSNCDCRVYHLSYQEELWANDDEKAETKTKSKKNKKQKKKAARDKKKTGPPAKNTSAADAKNPPLETIGKTELEKGKMMTTSAEPPPSTKESISNKSTPSVSVDNKSLRNDSTSTTTDEKRSYSKTSSPSPNRGTIDDDSAGGAAKNTGAQDTPLEMAAKTEMEKGKTTSAEPPSSAKKPIPNKPTPTIPVDSKTRRKESPSPATGEQQSSRKTSSSAQNRRTNHDNPASGAAKNTGAVDKKNPPLGTSSKIEPVKSKTTAVKTDLEKSKTTSVDPSSSTKKPIPNKTTPPVSADNKMTRNESPPTTTIEQGGSRNASSSPPNRETIDDDSSSSGDDNSERVMDPPTENNHDEPIDLVSYLQQTGSIIALAKLIDSLYADEKFDDEKEVIGDEAPQISVKQEITHAITRQ